MPETIENLLRRGLGPDTWLGRALRFPADVLLRRIRAEMQRETNLVREEITVLRADMARLAEDLSFLREDMALLSGDSLVCAL